MMKVEKVYMYTWCVGFFPNERRHQVVRVIDGFRFLDFSGRGRSLKFLVLVTQLFKI